MKTLCTLALLAALPLAAQERYQVSLTLDQQSPKSQTYDPVTLKPEKNSGMGLGFGWQGWTFGQGDLNLTATYRFKATSTLRREDPSGSDKAGDFASEHLAVGAQYLWHKPFDIGFGLEARYEKLALESDGVGDTWSAHQIRPWLTATAGYTFPKVGVTRPFVALNLALPLTSESKPTAAALSDADAQANRERLVKSMASGFDVALQVGLRF